MISLPALEEPFAQQYPPTQDGPRVRRRGRGERRRPAHRPVHNGGIEFARSQRQADGRRRARRDAARRGAEGRQDPGAGHGKTDYKVLRAQIEK